MTKVTTIAEAHEAIEGSRNVDNVVVLSPNAGNSSNKESDREDVLAESMEEIYKPAGGLEIKGLESDDQAELPLPTSTKRRRQELPGWKKVSGFENAFQREKPNFTENLSDL